MTTGISGGESPPFPSRGRLLGVDYGRVRVGLAVCDPERRIASPLDTYELRSAKADAAYFTRVVEEYEVVGLVVGLPLHAGGEEGESARAARAFGDWLGQVTGRPVVYWDERLTTWQAERALLTAGLTHRKRRTRRDRVAAHFILQGYLDAGCPPGSSGPADPATGPDPPAPPPSPVG